MRKLLAGLSLALFVGCGGDSGSSTQPGATPVASVEIAPASGLSVTIGLSGQLTATTKDASGNVLSGRAVAWRSSNETIASISSIGAVSGLALGAATMSATSEGKVGSVGVTIIPVVYTATGTFTGVIGSQALSVTLLQSGSAVSGVGTITNTPTGTRALSITGSFTSPNLIVTITSGSTTPFSLQGTIGADAIAASLTGAGFNGDALSLYRSGSSIPGAASWTGSYNIVSVNGSPAPGSYVVLGYSSTVIDRALTLAADGTGTWRDSSTSSLYCPGGAKTGPQCSGSGKGSVAWTALANTLNVAIGAPFAGRFVSPKIFVRQADGTLLKTDDSEIEIYKRAP